MGAGLGMDRIVKKGVYRDENTEGFAARGGN